MAALYTPRMEMPGTAEGHYCPNCGYDLCAATGKICPECGAAVGRGIASLIPWRQRKWRGLLWSYLATVHAVVKRPSLFCREVQSRVPARDVRQFARINMLVTTLIGTAMCAAAFACRGKAWADSLPNWGMWSFQRSEVGQANAPIFVLLDQWYCLIPAALSIFTATWINQWLLRRLLAFGAGDAHLRRRVGRIGAYFGSILAWEALLMGVVAVMAMLRMEQYPWVVSWQGSLAIVQLVSAGLAAWVMLGPPIYLILRTSRRTWTWKWRYWAMMIVGVVACALIKSFDEVKNSTWPGWRFWKFDTRPEESLSNTAAWTFVVIALGLIAAVALWKWRWQALRVLYYLVLYPLAHLVVWVLAVNMSLWLCGFVAMAVGSMLHH